MLELIGYTGEIKINRSLALTGSALKSISITVRIRFRELRKISLYWSNNFDFIAMVPLTNYISIIAFAVELILALNMKFD